MHAFVRGALELGQRVFENCESLDETINYYIGLVLDPGILCPC